MVCFIHRPEYFKIYKGEDEEDLTNLAEFIIAKHRNGATGTIKLKFKHQFARFEDYEDNRHAPLPKEQFPSATKTSTLSAEEAASLGGMSLNMPENSAPLPDDLNLTPFGPSDPVDNNPPF